MRSFAAFALACVLVACGEPKTLLRTSAHKGAAQPAGGSTHPASLPPIPRISAAPPGVSAQDEPPNSAGAPFEKLRLDGLDTLIARAIRKGQLPGCVIAVGTRDELLYLKAFGERTTGEAMTVDTVFDLASLTKPIATATSLMKLQERGALSFTTELRSLWPELEQQDPQKGRITIEQLLTHTAGLRKVLPLPDFEQGEQRARDAIFRSRLAHPRGSVFEYSDLGFIVLGDVVAKLSGETLDQFATREIFEPLGMSDTHYLPSSAEIDRIAPTEERDGLPIRGVVDDPRAYRLGGVAGHAGLFATASDLARFSQMLLGGGSRGSVRILSPETVSQFVKVRSAGEAKRTLGFDSQSSYSDGRGFLLSEQAFGHGGYTGTSLWIDPQRDLFVVLLSNRVHAPRGVIHPLASSIADLAAYSVEQQRSPPAHLSLGIDRLQAEAFARLRGARVGLLTHFAAHDSTGATTVARMLEAPRVSLNAIFAPEHGLSSKHEGEIGNASYGNSKIPVYGLFGKTRSPTPEMLSGLDAVVIDLVDVGTRFYTYTATALRMLEACAALNIDVIVLDRPNPIGANIVEGPISESTYESFVNYHPLPLRHGMTEGELLTYLARKKKLAHALDVVRLSAYPRDALFADLGIAWFAPSPNLMRSEQALLYPAVALVEGTNVSVGRGTSNAFEVVAAPFIDGEALAARITELAPSDVEVLPTRITPSVGPYRGQTMNGVRFRVLAPATFRAAPLGLAIARALSTLYSTAWDDRRLDPLIAHAQTLTSLREGRAISSLTEAWAPELEMFETQRKEVLLY